MTFRTLLADIIEVYTIGGINPEIYFLIRFSDLLVCKSILVHFMTVLVEFIDKGKLLKKFLKDNFPSFEFASSSLFYMKKFINSEMFSHFQLYKIEILMITSLSSG